eukprot:CAMPEP_0115640056 /NCGR_PEP_ID=MMETSP0272-20121206/35587_1 /TAXON_ID=71861 /ORGANISM="Scrippsiella trochoidea, Strain CCMP3099" /LENGTH=141 /DNA_ID=CAMNT_0003077279 /DNA_START=49 /DNA_END=476 /DNA_ORIENTATION=-
MVETCPEDNRPPRCQKVAVQQMTFNIRGSTAGVAPLRADQAYMVGTAPLRSLADTAAGTAVVRMAAGTAALGKAAGTAVQGTAAGRPAEHAVGVDARTSCRIHTPKNRSLSLSAARLSLVATHPATSEASTTAREQHPGAD